MDEKEWVIFECEHYGFHVADRNDVYEAELYELPRRISCPDCGTEIKILDETDEDDNVYTVKCRRGCTNIVIHDASIWKLINDIYDSVWDFVETIQSYIVVSDKGILEADVSNLAGIQRVSLDFSSLLTWDRVKDLEIRREGESFSLRKKNGEVWKITGPEGDMNNLFVNVTHIQRELKKLIRRKGTETTQQIDIPQSITVIYAPGSDFLASGAKKFGEGIFIDKSHTEGTE